MSTRSNSPAAALLALCAIGGGLWPVVALGDGVALDPGQRLRELVERTALEVAVQQIEPPDRFEVTAFRYGGGDATGEGRLALEPLDVEGPNQAGYMRLRFRVTADGRPAGEVRATVRGAVVGPVLVAEKTLLRGRPVPAEAVRVTEENLTRLVEPPLRSPRELVDRVPLRTLGRGRLLTSDLLRAAPVVRRGDTVELKIEREKFVVTTKGRVMRDGAPGETVPAENLRTGARLEGRVREDGSLLVVRGAVAGRLR